jgi:uncharacterized protein YndB with AHSA1/START domain
MAPTDFVLVSNWRIAAPHERVWEALLRPAFAWNHNAVMAAGEIGLSRHLGVPAG